MFSCGVPGSSRVRSGVLVVAGGLQRQRVARGTADRPDKLMQVKNSRDENKQRREQQREHSRDENSRREQQR